MLRHGFHNFVRLNCGLHRQYHVPRNINPTVLTTGCIEFLKDLNAKCKSDHTDCLTKRAEVFKTGVYGYREDTRAIREGVWIANTIPDDLKRRHVEITGPGNDAKMVINALNTEANGYMLDLKDSKVPSLNNVMGAHENITYEVCMKLSAKKLKKTNQVENENVITNRDLTTVFVRVHGMWWCEG